MQTFQQIVLDFKARVGCLNTSRGELPATFCPVLHNPPTSLFLDEGAANLYFFQRVSRLYGPSLFKIQQVSVYCQDLRASTALVSRFLSASSFSQGSKIEGILVVAALVLSLVASILCQHPAIHNYKLVGLLLGAAGRFAQFLPGVTWHKLFPGHWWRHVGIAVLPAHLPGAQHQWAGGPAWTGDMGLWSTTGAAEWTPLTSLAPFVGCAGQSSSKENQTTGAAAWVMSSRTKITAKSDVGPNPLGNF